MTYHHHTFVRLLYISSRQGGGGWRLTSNVCYYCVILVFVSYIPFRIFEAKNVYIRAFLSYTFVNYGGDNYNRLQPIPCISYFCSPTRHRSADMRVLTQGKAYTTHKRCPTEHSSPPPHIRHATVSKNKHNPHKREKEPRRGGTGGIPSHNTHKLFL